jgi:hypothetical protein
MLARLRFACLILATTLPLSCSRGVVTDLPAAPTPPAATLTLTRLTITPVGGGNVVVGGTAPIVTSGGLPSNAVALGAFAEYDRAPGRYVEATWTSSDSSVLTVANNTMTALKRGSVTLTATFGGRSDTEEFVVEGGIGGRWAGSAVVEQCAAGSGSMQDLLCRPATGGRSGMAPVGATLPFSMEITENGTELSGTVTFGFTTGSMSGTLRGLDRGGGFFYLLGTIDTGGGSITLVRWDTRVVRDAMEGTVAYEVRLSGVPSHGAVGTRLANMTRQ